LSKSLETSLTLRLNIIYLPYISL